MKLFLIFYLIFFISIFKANSKKLIIADISDNKINIDVCLITVIDAVEDFKVCTEGVQQRGRWTKF